ncbi:hypothetical protein [Haliangium sp.]|uniref:hypothetical protein n=1 Tax=Haliangium sp. TaxID=2663208 RepID=UPI003D0D9E15
MNRQNKDKLANSKSLQSKGRAKRSALSLNRTTLRELQSRELGDVVGGGTFMKSQCFCPI